VWKKEGKAPAVEKGSSKAGDQGFCRWKMTGRHFYFLV
jgi:hypothetical protein